MAIGLIVVISSKSDYSENAAKILGSRSVRAAWEEGDALTNDARAVTRRAHLCDGSGRDSRLQARKWDEGAAGRKPGSTGCDRDGGLQGRLTQRSGGLHGFDPSSRAHDV